jgi:Tfp pilus assembly protein PilP
MKLLITTVVAALALGACARAEDPRLANMPPEQRAQVLQQIYELRAAIARSTEWDYRPLRTTQPSPYEFKPLTFCNTTGPFSYRTTVCN